VQDCNGHTDRFMTDTPCLNKMGCVAKLLNASTGIFQGASILWGMTYVASMKFQGWDSTKFCTMQRQWNT